MNVRVEKTSSPDTLLVTQFVPSNPTNPMKVTTLIITVASSLAVTSCTSVFAAATASDSSANYNSGNWGTTAPNNGTGFGDWGFTLHDANNPPYVGTYYGSGGPIANGGSVFGTYANGGDNGGSINILREFTAGLSGSTSLYNQTFSVDLTSAGVGNGNQGPVNSLLGINIGNAFSFDYLGTGTDNFLFNDGSGNVSTPVNFTDLSGGLAIYLTVSGALNSPTEGYTFTVQNVSGSSTFFTTSGTFNAATANTSSFSYTDSNTTGDGFFNSLNISPEPVPEPATLALLGFSSLATMRLFRRRK